MSNLVAYLDPGSASMIMTAIAGGVGAAAVTLKMYFQRILVFLRIRKPEQDTAGQQS